MPANSCHGDGEALGGSAIADVRRSKQLRQRRMRKLIKGCINRNTAGEGARRKNCHKYIISDVGKNYNFFMHMISLLFVCVCVTMFF